MKLRAEWLVCKDVCIPEEGEFAIEVPAQAATAGHAALFDGGPRGAAAAGARRAGHAPRSKAARWSCAWPACRPPGRAATLAFFPETAGVIANAAQPAGALEGGEWTARVPLDPQRSDSPDRDAGRAGRRRPGRRPAGAAWR